MIYTTINPHPLSILTNVFPTLILFHLLTFSFVICDLDIILTTKTKNKDKNETP